MATDEQLAATMRPYRARIDAALEAEAAGWSGEARLLDAMRYALFTGGKRIRPCMAQAAAEACGASADAALPAGVALELIHTYSLVHDDLPAMDDDDLRRGMPTVHRHFDEATAILAGDALLTAAFACIAQRGELSAAQRVATVVEVARAAGHAGMVGGQSRDIARAATTLEALSLLHAEKTGALFVAACRCGAISAGADTALVDRLGAYGAAVGEAFQISDDLLDDIEAGELRDEHEDSVNLAVKLGRHAAAARVEALVGQAHDLLGQLPSSSVALAALADWIGARAQLAAAQ